MCSLLTHFHQFLLVPSHQSAASLTSSANPSPGFGPVAFPWVTLPCSMPPPALAFPSSPSPWPPASPAAPPFPTAPPASRATSSSSPPTMINQTPSNLACSLLVVTPTTSCSSVRSSKIRRVHPPAP